MRISGEDQSRVVMGLEPIFHATAGGDDPTGWCDGSLAPRLEFAEWASPKAEVGGGAQLGLVLHYVSRSQLG